MWLQRQNTIYFPGNFYHGERASIEYPSCVRNAFLQTNYRCITLKNLRVYFRSLARISACVIVTCISRFPQYILMHLNVFKWRLNSLCHRERILMPKNAENISFVANTMAYKTASDARAALLRDDERRRRRCARNKRKGNDFRLIYFERELPRVIERVLSKVQSNSR